MAGGIGTRFWPKSRQHCPKQFLDILGTGKTFIQMTYERFAEFVPADHFLVVTNARYKSLVREQLPDVEERNILCEPVGRNTAPCICYAAYHLACIAPDSIMVVTPADHLVLDRPEFCRVLGDAIDFVDENEALMTIGITPNRPETGYGYIQKSDNNPVSKVKCFTEKPNLELAQAFVQCGEFFWNAGIFVWKTADILAALRTHLPEHTALFESVADAFGTEREAEAVEGIFGGCRAISIDYGVMEKADNVYVRCGDFGWSDVGTWSSIYRHSRKDKYANAKPAGGCYTYDVRNSMISLPEGKVAVVSGLRDFIVVDTDDVLMICPRSEEQNIKKYIDDVKYNEGEEHI